MTITINGVRAPPVTIQRGSPHGSVLGCLLLCVTTQHLTSKDSIGNAALPRYFPQGSSDDCVEFWRDTERAATRSPEAFLYVDDTTLFQPVPLVAATRHFTSSTTVEEQQDLKLEGVLHDLEQRATAIGIKINGKKTQLLVISPRNGCLTSASLCAGDGVVIQSQETMKLVGLTFGDSPNTGSHVEVVVVHIEERCGCCTTSGEQALGTKTSTAYTAATCNLAWSIAQRLTTPSSPRGRKRHWK